MLIKRYQQSYKQLWDNFVINAKNSHFFFQRDYIEYHSDRFDDYSLLFFDKKDNLIAVLPANKEEHTLYSHQGLTFGGLIFSLKLRVEQVLILFDLLQKFLTKQKIERVIYKVIPHIYHSFASEEDKYALFKNNAQLIRVDLSSTIFLEQSFRYSKGRKWMINKAKKSNIIFKETNNWQRFWIVLEKTLEAQHQAKPVHSVEEIEKLVNLFPQNIRLFVAIKNSEILAGAVIFENKQIVHTQYLANSLKGRDLGALDFVIDKLISEVYKNKKYFDFGISNEKQRGVLNTGLIAQKEGFGARAITHDLYEWSL